VVFALCGFGLTRAAAEIANSWGGDKLDALRVACGGQVRDSYTQGL